MAIHKKMFRSGNSWALSINSVILGFLDINPEVDKVHCVIEKDKLIITKSDEKIED